MSSKVLFSLAAFFAITLCVIAYDPKTAVGPCIMGRCQAGHVCANGECYPKMKDIPVMRDYVDVDAKGQTAIGPCVNGFCPRGHECITNKCYKSKFV